MEKMHIKINLLWNLKVMLVQLNFDDISNCYLYPSVMQSGQNK